MADDVLRQGVQGITDLITVRASSTSTSRTSGRSCATPGRRSWALASPRARTRRRGRAHRRLVAAARDVDRGRDRHPPQRVRPDRRRPLRGERGRRGRHGRGRSERECDLRRRDRRLAPRRGQGHRDRDRFRRASAPPAPRVERRRGAGARDRAAVRLRARRARRAVVPARRVERPRARGYDPGVSAELSPGDLCGTRSRTRPSFSVVDRTGGGDHFQVIVATPAIRGPAVRRAAPCE